MELKRREPHLVHELHRQSGGVARGEHDEIDEALHHLLRAGDVEQAGDLVAAAWWSRFATGRALTARRWLDDFSPEEIRAQLDLRAGGLVAPGHDGGERGGARAVRSGSSRRSSTRRLASAPRRPPPRRRWSVPCSRLTDPAR